MSKEFFEACEYGDYQTVESLLDSTNINKLEDGQTALMRAIHCERKDIVELLIKRGADLNIKSDLGMTPLMFATNNLIIAKLIIENNRNINEINYYGASALWFAIKDNEI